MVLYDFYCPECDEKTVIKNPIDKDLPQVLCPKCDAYMKQCIIKPNAITCTSGHAVNERCKSLAREDRKAIERGDDNALSDLVGEKPNPLK